MEERKKRWRPSLTEYREVEEVVHRQCVELDAWREKYHALLKSKGTVPAEEYGNVLDRNKTLSAENLALKDDNGVLESSNMHLEEELNRVREVNNRLSGHVARSDAEIRRLKGRGFWERLLNK